ncbi:MAG: hypothetical protein GWN58_21415, partial [Anaerolineae bacterium]|nr:hypothetical protein [Anaerolineae bacterium]
ARPLRRALQRHLESPLSVRLLRGDFDRGDLVVVDAGQEGLVFERKPGLGKLGEQIPQELVAEPELVG